ncbi:ATP-binding protein [Sporosarcina contaminans]|uniref:histidine kinase n=1 Tax=Sporosarcina contaminans TaxID=633403 RepID=A0ABW3U1Y1_9BACL
MDNHEKALKSMSLLMDDSKRPGLVLDIDGAIRGMNDHFKIHFTAASGNIKDLIDLTSQRTWDQFVERALHAQEMIMELLPMTFKDEQRNEYHVHLIYMPDLKQVIALFDAPTLNDRLSNVYVNAFRKSNNFMLLVDLKGEIYDVNEMHSKFINKSREELIGKSLSVITKLIHPDKTAEYTNAHLAKAKEKGQVDVIIPFYRAHDDTRYYHITTYHDKETNMFIIQMADCTEKENLEVQLAHSGSLSAVGQLAASVAHEIRNPITTLKGFTQLLRVSASEDSIRYITVIEDEIERMESILSQMLVLSKPSVKKKAAFSLSELIEDMASVLYPKALMEGIEIIKKSDFKKAPMIFGDAAKMKQVLLNLFKNSLDAMQAGGTLTICLQESDDLLVLSVQDTGKGMNHNQINQVFMPFFSSKPGGTGLGLPFVLKTVEEHGGTISVESEVGKGTLFTIKIPFAADKYLQLVKDRESIVS